MIQFITCLIAFLFFSAPNPTPAPHVTSTRRENSENAAKRKVHKIEFGTAIGKGEARFVVKIVRFSESEDFMVNITDPAGRSVEIGGDGLEHEIKVPVSFPAAAQVLIDAMPVLIMFKAGEPVYFLQDTSVGWALVSAETDPRMGKAPAVRCRRKAEACVGTYVEARDPPLARDKRCPDPKRASGATAKLCYVPGQALFTSDVSQVVEILDWTIDGPQVRRPIQLKAGQLSEPVTLEYERTRPTGVRISGKDYFLAVGHGKTWVVQIDSAGGPEAREQISTKAAFPH